MRQGQGNRIKGDSDMNEEVLSTGLIPTLVLGGLFSSIIGYLFARVKATNKLSQVEKDLSRTNDEEENLRAELSGNYNH